MIKKIIQAYIRFMQKVIISTLLFFLYFLGFGITAFFLAFFKRRVFFGTSSRSASFWQTAEGYEDGLEKCARES